MLRDDLPTKPMKPVAILRPTKDESPGTLAEAFDAAGLPVEIVDLFRGEAVAADGRWSGWVVLGGTLSVRDAERHSFMRETMAMLAAGAAAEMPILGICLGSQLLAAALGAEVRRNEVKEIGWYRLELTDAGRTDPLLSAWAEEGTAFQWHGDTFALPEGAVRLAGTAGCVQQAFRYGRAVYGVQFHPEVTRGIMEGWVGEPAGRAEIGRSGGAGVETILRQADAELVPMQGRAATMFAAFAKICRGDDAAAGGTIESGDRNGSFIEL